MTKRLDIMYLQGLKLLKSGLSYCEILFFSLSIIVTLGSSQLVKADEAPSDNLSLEAYEDNNCLALPRNTDDSGSSSATDDVNQGIVLGYDIKNSSLYEDDENTQFRNDIDAIISPHIGEFLLPAHLKAIQDEITLQYFRGGYITSRADSLTIQNGMLIVPVIEGYICEVRFSSQIIPDSPAETTELGRRIVSSYFEPIVSERPVNLAALNGQIQEFLKDYRFDSGKTIVRLRNPMEDFLDRYIRLYSSDNQANLEQNLAEMEFLIEDNDDLMRAGASILEIAVEVNENIDPLDPAFSTDSTESDRSTITRSLDDRKTNAFENYFGQDFNRQIIDPENIHFALSSLELQNPDLKAAVIYIASEGERVFIQVETAQGKTIEIENITQFEPEVSEEDFKFSSNQERGVVRIQERDNNLLNEDRLPPQDSSLLEPSDTVQRDELVEEVENLWREVQKPNSTDYLQHSDNLYDLLIRPIENELKEQEIEVNTFLVSMDSGLGLLPLAALYDSETGKFLSEKYRISIIPNFRSLDLRPSDLSQSQILAMGASEFRDSDTYSPLNAVPLELALINRIWPTEANRSNTFLNETFTLENLRNERQEFPYQIIHLATHANFRPGEPEKSSIQLWDIELPLNNLQISTLNWNHPPVDLLVLSACQTALGDEQAQLGFAGLSLQAEVKSVLASLWYVSDLASLIYMMEFYRSLSVGMTKAEAVQNAQVAMLDEQRIMQNLNEIDAIIHSIFRNDQHLSRLTQSEIQGLQKIANDLDNKEKIIENFRHPFYWSAYTLVGSPW